MPITKIDLDDCRESDQWLASFQDGTLKMMKFYYKVKIVEALLNAPQAVEITPVYLH